MTALNPLSNPLISIAIVTWNRSSEVLRAIRSIHEQSYPHFEIVVADNHSSDNTPNLVEKAFPATKVIRLHRNLGACGGRNVALSNCRGDIIFNLDDDAIVQSDTIPRIIEFFQNAPPQVGLVACQVFENGSFKYPKQSGTTAIFEGCGWAIRRIALHQVGYFSDHLFRAAEETDFSLTFLVAGYQMWYLSEAIIHHMPSKVRAAEVISFYKCRNELIIIFERYPVCLIIPFVLWTLITQIKASIRQSSHLPYVISGFFHGLIQAPIHLYKRRPVPFSTICKVRFSPMHRSKLSVLFSP